jgi:hypothetical protein
MGDVVHLYIVSQIMASHTLFLEETPIASPLDDASPLTALLL